MERPLSMILPATGILVGDGVLGELVNGARLGGDIGPIGEPPPRVADAINAFRSDKELRRLFFFNFTGSAFSSGGGDAPIVLSLVIGLCELEGRLSSKVPNTVGLSREIGRLGDSIDLER